MQPAPYPLRTEPLFRDYLWGGRNLESKLGKSIPSDGLWAESWEIIDHPEHQSRIANGQLNGQSVRTVAAEHASWLFGEHAGHLSALPLLLKYLDCQNVLSVQVHPSDDYALKMDPPDLGKTEAWFIVDAEPGAVLYAGLKTGVTRQELKTAIQENRVADCLHEIQPAAGDCVFIPAGTVHALGAGLLVAEIQQASNTTFRLDDWNRLGVDGKPRPLHIDQALEVIDFESGPRSLQKPKPTDEPQRVRLVDCDKFIFDAVNTIEEHPIARENRFHLITAPCGGVDMVDSKGNTEHLDAGQSMLLPAAINDLSCRVASGCILLDMYLPHPI